MERFPRGSLPPFEFAAVATVAPTAVSKPPTVVSAETAADSAPEAPSDAKQCDLSTTCPNCGTQMQPEHAHYKCAACGYRDSCCF
ncbi:MAG TPA: hypothetical protein VIV40_03845 [Kofleriaceae bacterium]